MSIHDSRGHGADGTSGQGQATPGQITLSAFYHSAVNAVTEPNRLVFCSRYLVTRWSPLLGGTGLQILLFLRSRCFHDRRTGECRDEFQVSRADLAEAVGVSEATVKRELAQNGALRRFVQPQQEYTLSGGRGGLRRDANSYRVAMDDPIHDDDWPRVEAAVRQAEERLDKGHTGGNEATEAKRRARTQAAGDEAGQGGLAPGQIEPALIPPETGVGADGNEPFLRRVNLTPPPAQIDPTRVLRDLKTQKETLNVAEEVNSVVSEEEAGPAPPPQNVFEAGREDEVHALVEELRDWGSESRHRQLLAVCDRHGLCHLPRQALQATRSRIAREKARGVLEKPGAYYQRILITLLEGRQVFIPKAEDEDPAEVRRLARESMGLSE